MLRKKKKLGFTLIELLVVIAILGVFASIILTATKNVRSNARDVRRIIELTQITKALEIYYIDKGVYPSPNNKINLDDNWFDMLSILADEGYISQSDLVKQKKPIWSKLILGVEAGVWQPDYSKTTPQDPLYPNRTYAYIPSVNHQKYRIRCQFENLDNSVLNNSLEGYFLYNDQSTGDNACDISLGYYCIGISGDFDPGN